MVSTYIQNDKIIITINIESINIFSSAELKKYLLKIPIESDENIVLDMRKVMDIDSSGLGQLIAFWQHLKRLNNNMALANCTEKVKLVLKITNVNKMIPVYETIEASHRIF